MKKFTINLVSSNDGRRRSSMSEYSQSVDKRGKSTSTVSEVECCESDMTFLPPPKSKRKAVGKFFRSFGMRSASNLSSVTLHSSTLSVANQQSGTTTSPMPASKPQDRPATANVLLIKQKLRSRSSSRVQELSTSNVSSAVSSRRPLNQAELQAMFEGAPHFSVEHLENEFKPQIGTSKSSSRNNSSDAKDCSPPSHPSFELATLNVCQRNVGGSVHVQNTMDKFKEIPDILNADGVEIGTASFGHFLQSPFSAHLEVSHSPAVYEKRALLSRYPERFGLRKPNLDAIVDRLSDIGVLHAAYQNHKLVVATINGPKISEMGEQLFAKFLSIPKAVGTTNIPLRAQIESLQNVLSLPGLLYDFSLPYVRLRVGKLLWSNEAGDQQAGSEEAMAVEPGEGEILLLQIMLASELLLRLNAVKVLLVARRREVPLFTDADSLEVDGQRTANVRWSLVLAERFLQNVEISATMPKNLFGKAKAFKASTSCIDSYVKEIYYLPKCHERQTAGLLEFASILRWPDEDALRKAMQRTLPVMPSPEWPADDDASIYATPLESPMPPGYGEIDDYFGRNHKTGSLQNAVGSPGSFMSQRKRPRMRRMETFQSVRSEQTTFDENATNNTTVGTWLSRSWLSGLVMPGEAASHFLISTMLEHSPRALEAVGERANLRSGFVYQGRSFWSKRSAVGRVMAATRGATECMGWISVPGSPLGQNEGWVRLKTQSMPHGDAFAARTTEHDSIRKDSEPTGKANGLPIYKDDFTFPHDGLPVMGNDVVFQSLKFDVVETTSTLTAILCFSSPINCKLAPLEVPLTYDVHFVSSFPCSKKRQGQNAWTHQLPTINNDDHLSQDCRLLSGQHEEPQRPMSSKSHIAQRIAPLPCHPLHKDYEYDVLPVASLLSNRAILQPEPCIRPDVHTHNKNSSRDRIVVLDCRGQEDLQLLARAWCAKMGDNALIARTSRTCLSCSVRESRALGVSMIIRV